MGVVDTLMLVVVILGGATLIVQLVGRRLRGPAGRYHRPVVIPDALPVVDSISGMVMLPGAIVPFEIRRPEMQAVVIEAEEQDRIIAIAPEPPTRGRIVCAARVTEARRDAETVHGVAQGVARVRLIARQPSGEWSVGLIVDAPEAKAEVSAAAEEVRELALRALGAQQRFPGALEMLRAVMDPGELLDLAAGTCGLPREAQAAVLETESLSARLAIARRSIEALTRR